MIYITGDTHGDWMSRLSSRAFPQQKNMTKDDYVIICGDFGIWHNTANERYALKWLDEKPFTTLFVGGNHENYDRLYDEIEFPYENWNGGIIQRIRPSIIHLTRGQVFNINGKKIFTMGGAASHDIQDGVLDPKDEFFEKDYKKLVKQNAMFRVKHYSWWEQEMPSEDEYKTALANLAKHDNKVDYIITHCCPTFISDIISSGFFQPDVLTDFFNTINDTVKFDSWYFGHYHDNKEIGEQFVLLYEKIIPIDRYVRLRTEPQKIDISDEQNLER